MKLVRFRLNDTIHRGCLLDGKINIIDGDIYSSYSLTKETVTLTEVELLAPVEPSKAVCVGLNYFDHAKEMNLSIPQEPLLFIKPSSCVLAPQKSIEYPSMTKELHYEAELAVVIKKTTKNIAPESAYDYILGYTCANDVTARDLQRKDGQWTRSKSFDTFLPLGPWVETEIDPHNIPIKLYVNGVLRQTSNTKNLIFKVPELVSFISQIMTLYPGDVILTGTPSGVGPMQIGDAVIVELDGIGRLENTVV